MMRAFQTFLVLGFLLFPDCVNAASRHIPLISPSVSFVPRRRQRILHASGRRSYSGVLLASSKSTTSATTTTTDGDEEPLINISPNNQQNMQTAATDVPPWQDLPFGWKVVLGTIELGYTVASQFISSYVMAYCLSSVAGTYGVLFKPATDGITKFQRWSQRNKQWGKSWGSLSAGFGGFDTGIRLLRNNKDDEWNSLIGSAFTGAFFARGKGPTEMAKAAILYLSFGYFSFRYTQKENSGIQRQKTGVFVK